VSKRLRWAGSALLLGVLAWRLDWRQLGAAFAGLDVRLWLAAVGVYVLAQGASSLRWQLLARPAGFGGPWRRYLAFYFVGMFFNLLLPTSVGGDVVRAWYLCGGVPGRRLPALTTVLADRAFGLGVLVLLACAAALCCPVPLAPWLCRAVAGLGAGLVLGLAALRLAGRLPGTPARRLAELARPYRGRPGLWLAATALSLAVQLANVVLVWLIGLGLGLEVPPGYYAVAVPLVTLLTLLPVSVNGLGLRELGMVTLLAPAGVPAAQAVTLSLLQFAAFGAAGLAGCGVYLFGKFPRPGPVVGPRGRGPQARRRAA
jgi:glycosyltransferase 2 family protein